MSFDYSMLSGKIVEKCGTQSRFAKEMSMSERSMSLKMNGKVDWRQDEILKACACLGIEHAEIPAYFFRQKVQ